MTPEPEDDGFITVAGCGTKGMSMVDDVEVSEALLTALNQAHALRAQLAEREAEIAGLREELRKANLPQWFYAEGLEDRCLFDPSEAIDYADPESSCVIEVQCGRPLPSIWCAVSVTDDEDADERYTFTEHATREEAEQALAKLSEARS